MKYTLSSSCLLFFVVIAFSQTTLEEYKYLTKGYKIQVESGLDIKEGYEMKYGHTTIHRKSSFNRNIEFKYLYRVEEEYPCATLLIMERTDTDYKDYLCIPAINSSSDLWEQAKKDFYKAADNWGNSSRDYTWGMVKMIASQAAVIPKSDRVLKIKYLFSGKIGVATFLENGTYGICPRCNYAPDAAEMTVKKTLYKRYKEFNKYLLLEDGTKMVLFENGKVVEGWKVFDFVKK